MGNSKGLTMAANREPYRSWVMRAPPGVEDPISRTAELAKVGNAFSGLWRVEGPPYNQAKVKGTNMPGEAACRLLQEFFRSSVGSESWIGTRELQAKCEERVSQELCGIKNRRSDKEFDALLQSCVRWLRPVPAMCLVGMPNFGCFMMHFYSNPEYKRWWSDRLATLVTDHVAHAAVCDGNSPLAGTKQSCELFRSVFDPPPLTALGAQDNLSNTSTDRVIGSLASQIERTVTVNLQNPDWATKSKS